jgi:UDP-2,3-diacylglucosamine pyrophosphatase LpxH
VEEDGFRVFFIHGHQFDPLLRTVYPLARASTWMMGRARRFGLRDVAEWFEHKDIVIKHERFRGPDGPYARAAASLLEEEEADAVIMGHTHVPDRIELANGVFANTGSCSVGQRMHVSIDTQARSVALVRA